MASTAVSTHTGGAGPLSLMSCVRESSPQESIGDIENDKNVVSKKKFWNPRKWFKRKNKNHEDVSPGVEVPEPKENLRSRSASELSETDEPVRRRSGTPMHPGLSVSHDSIFHSPNSGSELELEEAQSSSSLSIHHQPTQTELRLQTELSERLRVRRGRGDTSEDDEGLPRSPCCNSPTATEGLLEKTAAKNHPSKSHSTCSDGSLLSMGSSEIEEDSFGLQSRNSSKQSLYDKKPPEQDSEWELGPSSAAAPLNHSAAHHRVSVRPKRTHGAPRRKRPITGTALPTTPEVNEDSSLRSLTPETSAKETVTEVYSRGVSVSNTRTETQVKCSSLPLGLAGPTTDNTKLNRSQSSAGSKSQDFATLEEGDEKDDKKEHSIFSRLFPRRSGKKKKNKEVGSTATSYTKMAHEASEMKRSVEVNDGISKVEAKVRSGPASRQRVQPIEIPATPERARKDWDAPYENERSRGSACGPPESEKSGTSPLHLELESHFRQRKISSVTTSSKFSLPTDSPPLSPKSHRSPLLHLKKVEELRSKIVSVEEKTFESTVPENVVESVKVGNESSVFMQQEKTKCDTERSEICTSKHVEKSRIFVDTKVKKEETKSKVKIAGLSSLQQKVLLHNEDTTDNTFKSLTDFTCSEPNRPVTKSHSFKTHSNEIKENRFTYTSSVIKSEEKIEHQEKNIFKASSLDSIKNLQKLDNKSESSESLESDSSVKTSSTEYLDSLNVNTVNGITISGPSHTSVVSICSRDAQIVDSIVKKQPVTTTVDSEPKEQQVSITKIHVKQNSPVPEFLSIHLNKVDAKPSTNVVLTANAKETTPKITHEMLKKFSQEDIDIVDKEINEEIVEVPSKNVSTPTSSVVVASPASPTTLAFSITSTSPVTSVPPTTTWVTPTATLTSSTTTLVSPTTVVSPTTTRIYKKHSETTQSSRKSSLVSVSDSKPKISLRTKSNSLDIVDSLKQTEKEISKQKSVTDIYECVTNEVVMRRKSLPKRQDDEPELMKVFARRSLKLKDADEIGQQLINMVEDETLNKSRDSDKENQQDSPPEDRKKLKETKEPLIETKFVETTEVTLRKPVNNKFLAYQRTASLSVPKANEINEKAKDRPKTELSNKTWITKKEDDIRKIRDEVITDISPKSDFINEDFPTIPKNFNQRKAEWEKRAQEALKKSVP